jgi:ribosomal protein S18 acetylase RimI-like enzyme
MFHVRSAAWEDCASLAKVQVDSYRLNYGAFLPRAYLDHYNDREQEQDWLDWMLTHPEDVLLVAESASGEMVGYASGRSGLTDIPAYDCELCAIHVSPTWQKMGVGRQLMQSVAAQFAQRNCSAMMLWVIDKNKACSFYERLGGKVVGRQTIQPGKEDIFFVELAYGWPDINALLQPPES